MGSDWKNLSGTAHTDKHHQINTTNVAFIYKIEMAPRLSPRSGCPSHPALPCLYTTMFALYSSHIGCPNKFEFYGWGCTKSK
jgi:hypothetical protein